VTNSPWSTGDSPRGGIAGALSVRVALRRASNEDPATSRWCGEGGIADLTEGTTVRRYSVEDAKLALGGGCSVPRCGRFV